MFKIRECRKFMKKCKVCGELKFISNFYKRNEMKDGYENQCKDCRRNKAKSKYLLVCLGCRKEFTTVNKKQKFCSKECRNNHNKEEVFCDCCGKLIKLKKSRIKKSNHHFCSNECCGKWKIGNNHPLYNKEEVLCDYCGEPIKLPKSRIKNRVHHFCSTECHGKWKSENKKSENNPNWNPNLTDEERITKRNYEEYNDCIKQVLERDDYTCQVTGKRGGKLEVHHLNCYSDFKEGRTDINNCITLSKEIHRLFHKIYGKKHNTKEQFEEFEHRYINKEFKEVI